MYTPVGATLPKFAGPSKTITTRQTPIDRARSILAQGKRVAAKEPKALVSKTGRVPAI